MCPLHNYKVSLKSTIMFYLHLIIYRNEKQSKMRGLLTAPISEMKIYVENMCKYLLLAPDVRLEPLMYACLLLHVTTQDPLKQFLYRFFQDTSLSYNVFLRILQK